MSEQPSEQSPRRKPVWTAVAFVAVAALAATAGVLIAGNRGTGDQTAAPTVTVTAEPSDAPADPPGEEDPAEPAPEASADLVPAFAIGENRGRGDVFQGGAADRANVLVTTDWLAEQIDAGLEDSGVVLVDISEELPTSDLTRYVDGHIPGAQHLNWSTDFFRENTREFIDQATFTALAQRLGIDEGDVVVLYGDNNNWFAAYAVWVFKLYGVPDVRLLDGGLKKWEQVDQRELVQEVPEVQPGTFEAKPLNFDLRAYQAEVLQVATGALESTLVDIRSPDEYNGVTGVNLEAFPGEGATIWGHVPGAVNVPWGAIVNEDGTYRTAEEIRAIYEEAGVDFSQQVITYCRIGERASHTWFALSQILEADVKVYDGSWTEWGNAVGVPVQNNSGDRGGVWS